MRIGFFFKLKHNDKLYVEMGFAWWFPVRMHTKLSTVLCVVKDDILRTTKLKTLPSGKDVQAFYLPFRRTKFSLGSAALLAKRQSRAMKYD